MEIKLLGGSGTQYHTLASPATLQLLIPATLQSSYAEGEHIPLWYYDSNVGLWRQEGEGMVYHNAADNFLWVTGQVSHFTWWNVDKPITELACIRFQPVDSGTGIPLTNLPFYMDGITYVGGSQGIVNGNEVGLTGKRTTDPGNPERIYLLLLDGGIYYLKQDGVDPGLYHRVGLPELATAFSMPAAEGRYTQNPAACQDLGQFRIEESGPACKCGVNPDLTCTPCASCICGTNPDGTCVPCASCVCGIPNLDGSCPPCEGCACGNDTNGSCIMCPWCECLHNSDGSCIPCPLPEDALSAP